MPKKKKRQAPRGLTTPGRTKPASASAFKAAPGLGIPIALLQRYQEHQQARWALEEKQWDLEKKQWDQQRALEEKQRALEEERRAHRVEIDSLHAFMADAIKALSTAPPKHPGRRGRPPAIPWRKYFRDHPLTETGPTGKPLGAPARKLQIEREYRVAVDLSRVTRQLQQEKKRAAKA